VERVFWHSQVEARAICDQVLRNAHLIELHGPSIRMKKYNRPAKH